MRRPLRSDHPAHPARRCVGVIGCLAAVVGLAACGGDDDASGSSTQPAATLPPTTTIQVPLDTDRCEDEPDPADYPDGGVPTALRPCEPPDETTVQVIREGSGAASATGDGVVYHATVVRSEDGELVDSSWSDGRPHQLEAVGVGGEIPGVDQNLVGVQAGEVLRLDVVADDAFGDSPPAVLPAVEAGDDLTFVIEVEAVIPALVPENAPHDLSIQPSTEATEVTTRDVVVGEGDTVEEGDVVIYAMRLARGDTGVILIDSWHRGVPETIRLDPALIGTEGQPLPGLIEGLEGARVGGVRVITMPPAAAFGDGGQPALGLPPDTDVIVVAEILAAY